MPTKSMFLSKTVWLGILLVTINVLQTLQGLPIGAHTLVVVNAVLGVMVVVNRFFTFSPVTVPTVPVNNPVPTFQG